MYYGSVVCWCFMPLYSYNVTSLNAFSRRRAMNQRVKERTKKKKNDNKFDGTFKSFEWLMLMDENKMCTAKIVLNASQHMCFLSTKISYMREAWQTFKFSKILITLTWHTPSYYRLYTGFFITHTTVHRVVHIAHCQYICVYHPCLKFNFNFNAYIIHHIHIKIIFFSWINFYEYEEKCNWILSFFLISLCVFHF